MQSSTHSWLRKFQQLTHSIFDNCVRHPRLTVGVFFLVIVTALAVLPRLKIQLSAYDTRSESIVSTLQQADADEIFGVTHELILVFAAENGTRALSAAEYCAIEKWSREMLNENPDIASLSAPHQLRAPIRQGEKILFPTYLTLPCEENLTNETVAAELKKLTALPTGFISTSKDAHDVAILLNLKGNKHAVFGSFNPQVVDDIYNSALAATAALPALKVHVAGAAAFRWHIQRAIKKDMVLQLAILILIVLFFRVFFGTWRSGAWLVMSLVMNVILTYGLMAATKSPLDILSNNLLLMTAIASLEDFLFLSVIQRYSHLPFLDSYRKVLTASFLTTLTTVVGFWSLCVSDVEMIQNFGLWAGVAALFEWLFVFLFLPCFLLVIRRPYPWADLNRAWQPRFIAKLEQLKPHRRWIYVAAVLFFLGAWAFTKLRYDDHPAKNFPRGHLNSTSYEYLRESRGWEGNVTLHFTDAKADDIAERIRKVRSALQADPNVVTIFNPWENIKWFTRDLSDPDRTSVEAGLMGTEFFHKIFVPPGHLRAYVVLRSMAIEKMRHTMQALRTYCATNSCTVIGQSAIYFDTTEKIVPTLMESFGTSILSVVILLLALCWMTGQMRNAFAIVFSSIWSPVVMMLVIWVCDVPISLVTSVFAAVIVGLTGDNAIQYLLADEDLESGIEERAGGSVLLSLLLCLLSLTFLFQTLIPLRQLGVLFFIGFATVLAGDLWLLKALLNGQAPASAPSKDFHRNS